MKNNVQQQLVRSKQRAIFFDRMGAPPLVKNLERMRQEQLERLIAKSVRPIACTTA